MKRLALLGVLALVLVVAAPAFGQVRPDDVVDEVAQTGLYVEPGLDADRVSLNASIVRSGNNGVRLMVVLLDADPAGGAVTFADAVLDRVGTGTVLVLSGSNEGISSSQFDFDTLVDALDRGFDASERAPAGMGDEAFVAAVVDRLTGTTPGPSEGGSGGVTTGSGGGSGLVIMLAIIGGLVLLVVFAVRKGNTSAAASRTRMLEEAKGEIRSQLDTMANTILEITDLVAASPDRQDDTYLRQASATYAEADEAYTAASDLPALEALADRLDEARWQLDAAGAIAHGRPIPDKPPKEQRYVCFFDPTHPNATETAEITTPAGKQTVRVCVADAEKLRRGTQPEPRLIDVGGRRVPAPMAPKSHGGGGFDWLDVFSVLAGGAGQGASYDWGGSRSTGSRSRSYGVGRTSTSRRSSSSSRSSGSSRSSASSRSSSSSSSRAGNTRSRNR